MVERWEGGVYHRQPVESSYRTERESKIAWVERPAKPPAEADRAGFSHPRGLSWLKWGIASPK